MPFAMGSTSSGAFSRSASLACVLTDREHPAKESAFPCCEFLLCSSLLALRIFSARNSCYLLMKYALSSVGFLDCERGGGEWIGLWTTGWKREYYPVSNEWKCKSTIHWPSKWNGSGTWSRFCFIIPTPWKCYRFYRKWRNGASSWLNQSEENLVPVAVDVAAFRFQCQQLSFFEHEYKVGNQEWQTTQSTTGRFHGMLTRWTLLQMLETFATKCLFRDELKATRSVTSTLLLEPFPIQDSSFIDILAIMTSLLTHFCACTTPKMSWVMIQFSD